MSSGKILLGLLAGVVTGTLLGILFAPDMGWVTRKRIIKRSEDYLDSLTERINVFFNTLCEIPDDTEERVEVI